MQIAGETAESCGYGPDGRLACNSGLFLGYKRSAETPDGPDDWFAISGHARGGDSGGGVFNRAGKLVGVLWGTDGQEVAARLRWWPTRPSGSAAVGPTCSASRRTNFRTF